MIRVETAQASTGALYTPSLADLSRNASVISSSSSSSSTSSLVLNAPPVRPRPQRTFSSPRTRSPATPSRNNSRPPAYLTGDMGYNDGSPSLSAEARRNAARARSQSRNRSINGRLTAEDFEFGEELGEGSYSTVRIFAHLLSIKQRVEPYVTQVKRATLYTTGQEYAIKILDKGHLRRYGKLETALAEKNTLVRLGSGHPGIVRLHSTFQDDWSLCESLRRTLLIRMTHNILYASFRPGPRQEWRDAVSYIQIGLPLNRMYALLQCTDRGRVGVYACKGCHP